MYFPSIAALTPCLMESSPSVGPTFIIDKTSIGIGNAPARNIEVKVLASSIVKLPLITRIAIRNFTPL